MNIKQKYYNLFDSIKFDKLNKKKQLDLLREHFKIGSIYEIDNNSNILYEVINFDFGDKNQNICINVKNLENGKKQTYHPDWLYPSIKYERERKLKELGI